MAVLCEGLEGRLLEDALVVEVVEDTGLEHEEATVHVVVGEWLLAELLDCAILGHVHDTEARQRPDRGDGCEPPMGFMEVEQCRDVDIGEAVAIGDHEAFVADVVLDPLDATTGHGGLARVGDGHLPTGLVMGAVVRDLGGLAEADGEVVRAALVVEEEVLDVLTPVAGADDEVGDPVVGEALHDVPDDRATTDLDHRLRPVFGLFTEAGTESTR